MIRLDENAVAGVSPRRHRQRPATQQKLEQVVTKAAGLIADRGYAGVSMRSVSRAVNVSLASLYHYFKSKEDLLYQIQFRTFAALLRAQEETAARPGSPEARFRRLVIGHLAFFASHPNELKVCTYELDSLRGEMFEATEALRRRYYRLMASVVSELMNGSIPEGGESLESRHATLFVFGMLNWVFMWYDPARHGPLDQIGEEMLALILNGLKRPEARP
jgi:AcrR family transcriptional regulator